MTRKRFALISILILILASFPVLAQESQDVVEQEVEEEVEQESEIHEMDDVYRQMELFSTALSYVLRNYYEDLTKEDLEQAMNGAIRGMLQGLGDRYSFYQPETRRKREQEDLFFAKNVKSSIKLGHARGAVLIAAAQCRIKIFEYTPLEIKKSVVGYGRATKEQIRSMVQVILKLKTPFGSDTSDALAAAICHLNWVRFQ